MTDVTTIASGRFLSLVSRDGWEFATRANATGVVAVLALTAKDELLLVEQYRPPVGALVIELPAGLVGDEPDSEHEAPIGAAKRELLEETGFEASAIESLGSLASSAGLTDETVEFFKATDALRKSDGGGIGSEQITVHVISRTNAHDWLYKKMKEGTQVDAKVLAGLALLQAQR